MSQGLCSRAAIVACTAAALLAIAVPTTVQAQGRSEERAATPRGGTQEDENIRVPAGRNVRGEAGESAPMAKAPTGTRSRGANECKVHFDNRSALFIATYAEGSYRGELSPWGDVQTFVVAGRTRLYARATFTDGTVSTWGPRVVDCPAGGDYQWLLYQ